MADTLRHREPRRGLGWVLDEHGLVQGSLVQGSLLQSQRDPEPANVFLLRLLADSGGPDTTYTDQVRRDRAVVREISTPRGNTMLEHVHRATGRQERSPQGFR